MIAANIRSALRARLVSQRSVTMIRRNSTVNKHAPQVTKYATAHQEETFEEFTTKYEKEFEEAFDLFEVQRILNNCFSYDLVPAPAVIEKALQACRRVNDYPTAVRTFEALKHKVENKQQYEAYLEELKDIRQELGIDLKETLYADEA